MYGIFCSIRYGFYMFCISAVNSKQPGEATYKKSKIVNAPTSAACIIKRL